MSQHDTLTLEQALRGLLATGGVIAEASDGDLQAAIDDPHAEEIIKAQAAAILKARAALSATQPVQAAQSSESPCACWPGRMCSRSAECAAQAAQGEPVPGLASLLERIRPGVEAAPWVVDALQKLAAQPAVAQGAGEVVTLQQRVHPWLMACFGPEIAADRQERNHRFLEEALELVQACGCTASEAHQLVDYTFGRPLGEKNQEVGGVMITLAALCLANGLDMHAAGETELARIWTMVEKIRAKQAAKPKHSPLPQHVDTQPAAGADVPDMVEIMALADRYRYATDGKDATDVRELLRAEIAASGRQE